MGASCRFAQDLEGRSVPQVVIENPILNSPYVEPKRHFKFGDDGITDETVESRRVSSYFVPIPAAKKKGKQLVLDNEWTIDRIKENEFINQVRGRVGQWRRASHLGVARTTKLPLDYWCEPGRERRLFFCQIEAPETAIYLGEVAGRLEDSWIENQLREFNRAANPGLFRIAFKMATRQRQDGAHGHAHRVAGAQHVRIPPRVHHRPGQVPPVARGGRH